MTSLVSVQDVSPTTITAVAVTTAMAAVTSHSPAPLTVILYDGIRGAADFFPFDDLAQLNTGSSDGSASNDLFSLRDLIEDGIDGSQDIMLFSAGCELDDGVRNCPIACNDTTHFFGSLETFYNCAALASISYWARNTSFYYINDEAESNASAIMGAGSLATFDDRSVLDLFIGCAQESCDRDGLSVPCDRAIRSLSKDKSSSPEIFAAMANFCPSIEAEINPDIFGPGVLISYLLQASFSIALYLAVKLFTFYIQFSEKPRKRKPFTLTRIKTMIWPDNSAMSRTSVAIASTLVEFQEAQCWFVFAVQIASILQIVVNSQEGTFWGEIILNAAVAYHISLNGMLPMFLIQICLHNEGIRNWHTFLGFCAEYVLAIVAATQKVRFRAAFELFKSQSNIESCGGNPSPRSYCAAIGTIDGLQLSFFPHPLVYKMVFLVLDSIAMIVLILDQLMWTLRKHRRTKHIQIGRYRAGRGPSGKLKKPWQKFTLWFWRTLEVVYLIINVLYMISLTRVINDESFVATRWSYGQIIAMTVWGPVIVKLFDLILSGPQRNGISLNSGPPRLRIDNIINLRISMDDNFTDDERSDGEQRSQYASSLPPLRGEPEQEESKPEQSTKEDSMATQIPRERVIRFEGDTPTTGDEEEGIKQRKREGKRGETGEGEGKQ
ncbi:unnamed protein product [Clonostachys rhizophaga]|uniref:Uncharacterized protein n=1 Tax=Clonostachys rhizophaga TaxID=160324 RepID=A0A9N9YIE6_9HYPO|nr:unnamed protein product [Clonostachys rhizophaga]